MPTPRQKAPDPGLGYGSVDKERYLSPEFAAREWERVFERCWLYAVPAARRRRTRDVRDVRHRPGERHHRPHARGRARRPPQRVPAPWPPAGRGDLRARPARSVAPTTPGRTGSTGRCAPSTSREVFPDDLDRRPHDPQGAGRQVGRPGVDLPRPRRPLAPEYLGVLPEHLALLPARHARHRRRPVGRWDCNWKVAVDAFHETYHNLATHPQLMEYVADTNVQIDCYDRHSRFLLPSGFPRRLRVKARRRPNKRQAEYFAAYGFDVSTFEGTADEVLPGVPAPQAGLDARAGLPGRRPRPRPVQRRVLLHGVPEHPARSAAERTCSPAPARPAGPDADDLRRPVVRPGAAGARRGRRARRRGAAPARTSPTRPTSCARTPPTRRRSSRACGRRGSGGPSSATSSCASATSTTCSTRYMETA